MKTLTPREGFLMLAYGAAWARVSLARLPRTVILSDILEHPAGFEPAISELQSLALPAWLRVHRMLFYLNEKGKAYNPSIKGMF